MIPIFRDWRRDDGSAAVEFALVLPVFLMILLGILAYGIYFSAAQGTAQLAADAARASVAGISDAERTTLARNHVTANAASYAMVLNPAKITVVAGPVAGNATEFRVAVRYDASALPIFDFAPFIPLPEKVIERAAVIKLGGY